MIRDFLYILYCKAHKTAKQIVRKGGTPSFRMVSIDPEDFSHQQLIEIDGPYVNEIEICGSSLVSKKLLFPIENIVSARSNVRLNDSFKRESPLNLSLGVELQEAIASWECFLDSSIIPDGYKYSGLHYTGYISDNINQWCLPSWIWTNAALVRIYCNRNSIIKARQIADLLMKEQLDCGGWIVRNDYSVNGFIPTLAPNDSAYIANNALIEIYRITHKAEYLNAAIKCADWIITTARPDGLVWSGFDMKEKVWVKDHIIVDTGFTAALFANLYDITNEIKYKLFLSKFVNQYIDLFYSISKHGFSTSIDRNNKQVGGMFARGQAWALEGLVPAYRVLKSDRIKEVIDNVIDNLLRQQLPNGGWAYNFSKPFLGEDCKGVAVIAKSLIEWNKIEPNDEIIISGKKALDWCIRHTSNQGGGRGGIFSFCMEGAVVHSFYTKTAFVYTSAYALELYYGLNS